MPRLLMHAGACLLALPLLASPSLAQVTAEPFDPVPGDPQLALGNLQPPAGGHLLNLSVGVAAARFVAPVTCTTRSGRCRIAVRHRL